MKKDALARFKERKDKEKEREDKSGIITKNFITYWKDKKETGEKIAKKVEEQLGISYSSQHINRLYQDNKVLNERGNELSILT